MPIKTGDVKNILDFLIRANIKRLSSERLKEVSI